MSDAFSFFFSCRDSEASTRCQTRRQPYALSQPLIRILMRTERQTLVLVLLSIALAILMGGLQIAGAYLVPPQTFCAHPRAQEMIDEVLAMHVTASNRSPTSSRQVEQQNRSRGFLLLKASSPSPHLAILFTTWGAMPLPQGTVPWSRTSSASSNTLRLILTIP